MEVNLQCVIMMCQVQLRRGFWHLKKKTTCWNIKLNFFLIWYEILIIKCSTHLKLMEELCFCRPLLKLYFFASQFNSCKLIKEQLLNSNLWQISFQNCFKMLLYLLLSCAAGEEGWIRDLLNCCLLNMTILKKCPISFHYYFYHKSDSWIMRKIGNIKLRKNIFSLI